MSRWLLAVVGAVAGSATLVACTSNPFAPGGSNTHTLKIEPDKTSVRADLRDVATLTARVSSSKTIPSGATVRFSTQGGILLPAADESTSGQSLDATVSDTGTALVRLRCADANNTPFSGVTVITATLVSNGDSVSADVLADPVLITCTAVADATVFAFLSPQAAARVTDPNRVEVRLNVTDFDGVGAGPTQNVQIDSVGSGLSVADTATGMGTQAFPLVIHPTGGAASFFIIYPGDAVTRTGDVPVSIAASYTNSLGAPFTASLVFSYGEAPNLSSITFVSATSQGANAVVRTRGSNEPITVDMVAADTTAAVDVKVQLADRSGMPPPAGTLVKFSCASNTNVDNCRALTGLSVFTPDAGVGDFRSSVYVPSTIEPATANTPVRGVATVTFKSNAASTAPGDAVITAEFIPAGSTAVKVPEGQGVYVNMVDINTVTLTATLETNAISATETTKVTASIRRGTQLLQDREICIRLEPSSFARAFLNDNGDDARTSLAMVSTGPTGLVEVTVSPQSPLTRGPVTLIVEGADVAYDSTRDNANLPCQTTDPSSRTVQTTLQINRQPILQSMIFVAAEPTIIGVQGSGIPNSSRVTFLVTDDQNQPLSEQQVTFSLDVNGDPTVTVSPFDLTDASGVAEAFVVSGTQAASVIVRASAVSGAATANAASDPIAIVGGKPAWANLEVGVTDVSSLVFAGRVVEGLRDTFDGTERPKSTGIRVQLADRFANRVVRPGVGYQVQFRAETGNIAQAATSDPDGFLTVAYTPGPPFSMDTTPSATEMRELFPYKESHQDAPQPVFRTANPSDGNITLLVATRGEESFQDVNGNGGFDPGEPFVDLPEPFLDRNNDGLRATCDLPLDRLPVHHDHAMRLVGIGTFCNPYFDGDEVPNDPLLPTAADCKQHWCPDWDPQWNCTDVSSQGGKTAERVPATGPVTGGRIKWCPHWRFKDYTSLASVSIGGSPVFIANTTGYFDTTPVPAPLGFRPVDGYVMYPGIRAVVLADSTPVGGPAILRYSGTSFSYRGPGEGTFGTAVAYNPATATQTIDYITVSSAAGVAMHLQIDPLALLRFRAINTGDIDAQFYVTNGDSRAPFSDFDRSLLRVTQTDQFIDGNNNGIWDDVNGNFDTDTLIWKNLTLTGVGHPATAQGNQLLPSPVSFGVYPPTDFRLNSGMHLLYPDSDDTVSPFGQDTFVAGLAGANRLDVAVVVRDQNGNPVCPHGLIDLDFAFDVPDNDFTLGEDPCTADGVYVLNFNIINTTCLQTASSLIASYYYDPRVDDGNTVQSVRYSLRIEQPAVSTFCADAGAVSSSSMP